MVSIWEVDNICLYPSELVSEEERISLEKMVTEAGLTLQPNHSDADLLIVFSDSDVLGLVQNGTKVPPVLVVETRGDSSFFAQQSFDNFAQVLQAISSSDYEVEHRLMLQIDIDGTMHWALNDIYIESSHPNTRMRYDLLVDNRSVFPDLDSANAVLFSTPTGSTAMGLNLGGLVIQHPSDVVQFLAVASRDVVGTRQILSATSLIDLEVLDTQFPLFVQVDSLRLQTDQRLFSIRKAGHTLPLVQLSADQRASLQQKLLNKISFEDTQDLTSSAKFILHVLQQNSTGMTVKEIMELTHLTNQKTLRTSLSLLVAKGLITRRGNLEDMREHIYSFSKL
ncbi:MAG: hypothetical protein ACXAE3_13030 [Candidatus Kariarchaeaceae archaeon]|jgi:NAD kinase